MTVHQDMKCWRSDDKGRHRVVFQDLGGRLPVAEHCSLPPPTTATDLMCLEATAVSSPDLTIDILGSNVSP